jgi:hypothetical protein
MSEGSRRLIHSAQTSAAAFSQPQRGKLSKREFMKLSFRQEHRCAGCRELLHWDSQVDHIVPWSLTADDDPSNLQILCPNCHANKSGDEASKIRSVRRKLEEGRRNRLPVCVCWDCEAAISPYFDKCFRCEQVSATSKSDDPRVEGVGLRHSQESTSPRR